jgi:HNH endonuclease
MSNGRPWRPSEVDFLRISYPGLPTKELARLLGRSESAVYGQAGLLGLKKSTAYLASPEACRLRRGDNVGARTRFRPGHAAANKGLRRPGWAPGRMAETQFKAGRKPQTWKAIGSTRISKDGYLQRKVSDTGYPPRDWVGVHILTWQEAHGPVPPGHIVAFKDRKKDNTAVENLELLSRRELMLRNTIHNYPPELADVIRVSGALRRKIRRINEEQIDGSTQSPVRDARSAQGPGQSDGC